MHDLYANIPYIASKQLNNMIAILEKAKQFAKDKGISETELLDKKLAPDMFPLVRQIQIMSDNAKGVIARLAGMEPPKMEDTETTIDQCIERLKKTDEFVKSVDAKSFEFADSQKVVMPWMPDKYQNMADYILDLFIPNYIFHFTTAYGILRNAGMEIGKTDFIGGLKFHDLA